MYGISKLFATIHARTLRVKCCWLDRGGVPWGLYTAHMSMLYALNIMSHEKVVSLLNITELENCGSFEHSLDELGESCVFWWRNYYADPTHRGWSYGRRNWTLKTWNRCNSLPWRTLETVGLRHSGSSGWCLYTGSFISVHNMQ